MKNGAWLAFIFLVLFLPTSAIGQIRATAIIEQISGVAFLKQNGAAKQIRLDPRADFARPLYPGDQIRCGKGGRLAIRLVSGVAEISETSGWFTVPAHVSSRSNPVQKALDDYGRIGGREKGDRAKAILFSPADESVVRPESFVIRWIPFRKKCSASLVIRELGGKELWRQDDVDGTSGSLDSSAVRQKLMEYRSKVDEGSLLLKLGDSCGRSDEVMFTIFSAANEQSLKEDLVPWERESDQLVAHLGRASVFIDYKLFSQAAEEYEAALALSPHSRNLLMRTISEQRRAGNFIRAKELEKSIRVH